MKTKTIISLILFVTIAVLYFSFLSGFKSKAKSISNARILPLQNESKDFINCIFNLDYFGMRFPYDTAFSIKRNLNRYKYELNFNSIQIYGSGQGGMFNEPLNDYKNDLNSLMTDIDTTELKCFYGRRRIDTLVAGQRLEYEAEGGNNGFSYQHRSINSIPDSGRTVLHPCITGCESTPRILCDSIYENIQHSDLIVDFFSDADAGKWYLKPVMRIKESDFSNNDSTPVIRIDVINFEGDTIKSVTIKVRNFKDANDNYEGNYINDFNFSDEPILTELIISGDTNNLNKGRTSLNLKTSEVDFKIYWFGQVEVWFDKLIVDDEMGNQLFNSNIAIREIYQSKLGEEMKYITSLNHPSLYTFFTDEMVYSNLACVKYVQKIMKDSSSGEARLCCATTGYLISKGLRNTDLAHKILIDDNHQEILTSNLHRIRIFAFQQNTSFLTL